MITLPTPSRNSLLLGFWLAQSILVGVTISVFLALWLSPRMMSLAFVLIPLLALPGLLWPTVALLPYLVWNRVGRGFAQGARFLLMGLCYYIVLAAVGRAGSSLGLTRPVAGRSSWVSREDEAFHDPVDQAVLMDRSLETHWIRAFVSWSVKSENYWVCSLLPFVVLLSALAEEGESRGPEAIYTLF